METLGLFAGVYGAMLSIVIFLLYKFWDSMSSEVRALGKVFSFLLFFVLTYMFVGWKITMMTGGEKGMVVAAKGVSVENGEAIYWGRGRCTTCHSLGGKGSAIRCPNHGVLAGKFETAMGERMFSRAQEREAATGEKWHGVDYLWECLAEPGGYVVAGYKNEMPITFKPPINLNLEDIQSVIMYLWSQDGEPDINLVLNPPGPGKKFLELVKKTTEEGATASPFKTYINGDAEAGQQMFFDAQGPAPCIKCHTVQLPGAEAAGGEVGPVLTTVAGTRSVEYIIESILLPSAVIASGFEPIKVETVDGEIVTGVNAGVSDTEVKIKLSSGEERIIPINQLKGGKFGANPKIVVNTFGGKVKGWFLEETPDAIELFNADGSGKIKIPKTTIKSRIKTKDRKKIEGYIKAEDEENITIVINIQGSGFDAYKGGKEVIIAKKDIKKVRKGYKKPTIMSTMPGNFGELLSVKNLHDVVAFLQSLSS